MWFSDAYEDFLTTGTKLHRNHVKGWSKESRIANFELWIINQLEIHNSQFTIRNSLCLHILLFGSIDPMLSPMCVKSTCVCSPHCRRSSRKCRAFQSGSI